MKKKLGEILGDSAVLKAHVDDAGLVCLELQTIDEERKVVKTDCKGIIDVFLVYEVNGYFSDSEISEVKEWIGNYFDGIL
jgi:hypothetical protein